jgi:hypothetical protein
MRNPWTEDYDNTEAFWAIAEALAPLGIVDTVYHNDTCPSLGYLNAEGDDILIRVWIDYRDPEKREVRIPDMDDEEHWDVWLDFGGFGEPFSSRDLPELVDQVKQAIHILGIQDDD